jgi:phage regulator Rha-like protein
MTALVTLSTDKSIRTTSRIVAAAFGKEHRDVLKAIRNLATPEDFNLRNCGACSCCDPGCGKLRAS